MAPRLACWSVGSADSALSSTPRWWNFRSTFEELPRGITPRRVLRNRPSDDDHRAEAAQREHLGEGRGRGGSSALSATIMLLTARITAHAY
jgi:hypothetical protein